MAYSKLMLDFCPPVMYHVMFSKLDWVEKASLRAHCVQLLKHD